MAPLGDIVPYLGGQYSFSASDGRIKLVLGDKTLLTSVGQRNAIVNGAPVVLEAAVEERSGSAWMPVSSVWEAMGTLVKWDKTRQRLTAHFCPARWCETGRFCAWWAGDGGAVVPKCGVLWICGRSAHG